MKICYVDESGDDGVLRTPTTNIQPTLVISGLIVDYENLNPLTSAFLTLITRFFPGVAHSRLHLDRILHEIKGSELRKKAASNSRRERRHAFGVFDGAVELLERYDVRLIGRVWVKGIGLPFIGRSIYSYSIQSLFTYFQRYLQEEDDLGIFIAYSRTARDNMRVSHSIFTQKFKLSGDDFDRIIDLPTFAHSDNHSGLQLSDWICSGILTPMAIETYCRGHVTNLHIRPRYADIKMRYRRRIASCQFRYQEAGGRWRGGVTVSDAIAQRPGGCLFQP
jgi:hypothetical protein